MQDILIYMYICKAYMYIVFEPKMVFHWMWQCFHIHLRIDLDQTLGFLLNAIDYSDILAANWTTHCQDKANYIGDKI